MFTKGQTGTFLHAPTVQQIRRHSHCPPSMWHLWSWPGKLHQVHDDKHCASPVTGSSRTGQTPASWAVFHVRRVEGRRPWVPFTLKCYFPWPTPNLKNHHFILFPCELSTLDLIYSWNHEAFVFLCLANFTSNDALQIYLYCCNNKTFQAEQHSTVNKNNDL